MGLLWAIIIGFFAGLLARWLTPGRHSAGFIVTTLLGMVGAVLATLLGQWIGWYNSGEGAGLLGAVVGAATLLLLFRAFAQRG
jgi:uncharacterized membrane protein YeaQ/YmgE (transglycosylase-associated protein family)